MKKHFTRSRVTALFVLTVLALAMSSCSLAGNLPLPGSAPAVPTDAPAPTSAAGQPTQAPSQPTKAGVATKAPAPSKDAGSRISDSMNKLVLMDQKTLSSYHLEASGTEPRLNSKTKKVDSVAFTFTADVAGNDIHFVDTEKTDTTKSTESYIFDYGNDSGKKYSVDNGSLKPDLFAELNWAMLPLNFGLPLIYAATGPVSKGDEAIDGRPAEKFDVDTARAPAGTLGALKGFGLNVYSSKGTVSIDKETGALLKMVIDYEQDVNDPSNGGAAVGKGTGHIDLVVTQVGKVTVKMPDLPQGGTGKTPTAVPSPTTKAGPTATKAPTPKPSPTVKK